MSHYHTAPVAVVSTTKAMADNIIRELGINDAVTISPRQGSDVLEGMRLSAVLIDALAIPLPDDVHNVLYGNLRKTCGHGGMYSILRIG